MYSDNSSEQSLYPFAVAKASKQFVYDCHGEEYLDCLNGACQVGHCHPFIVDTAHAQMSKLTSSFGLLSDIQLSYLKKLVETLPEKLQTCFLLNSGAEANEYAVRMALEYTMKKNVIGHKFSQYCFSNYDTNSSQHGKMHYIPLPDMHSDTEFDAEKVINSIVKDGSQIACFISELVMIKAGIVIAQKNYFRQIYNYIRRTGGLCIADEINTGLGRTGESFWAFKLYDVVPDIVTIGKSLGNGHPIAAVFTTREIADKMPEFASSFGGNPVSCAIGLAVLDVFHNEKLLSAAKSVGQYFLEQLLVLKATCESVGEIRCLGMLVGIAFVKEKQSKEPAPDIAREVIQRLLRERILARLEGVHQNVLVLTPSLCFTVDNARHVASKLSEIIISIPSIECKQSKLAL